MSKYNEVAAALEEQVSSLEAQLRAVKQQINDLHSMGGVSSLDQNILNRNTLPVEVIRHVVNDNRKAVTLVFILNYPENEIVVGYADSGSAGTWDRKEGTYLARSRIGSKYQILIRLTVPMREATTGKSLVGILAQVLQVEPTYEGLSGALRKLKRKNDA